MSKTRWAFIHPFQLRLQRGIEIYLWNLASSLAQQGVNVDILTWAGPLDVPDYARISGIRLRQVPSVRYFQAQFAVLYYVYWLLKGNYQHVFVHFAGYGEGAALRLIRWIRFIPFSVVFHFPPSLVPHRYREFKRWGLQWDAAHLIGVSQATAKEVQQWSGRPCEVIGHGVDSKRFRPDPALREKVRQELGFGQDTMVLISVAAIEERKGIQWVIRAMPELLKENPDLHYLIVGDGSYRSSLSALVATLALESRVHFLGAKLDVHPYLCTADIMMVLSRGEASSISLLEAQACGLPSITSIHPPFDEMMKDLWGVKVDEKNIQQVASAVLRLSDIPGCRIGMGNAAQAWVTENHNWPQVARQYMSLVGTK
ncbi:MAG: glycosyltransferase family 4 protein [Chloroflexota bacterium]